MAKSRDKRGREEKKKKKPKKQPMADLGQNVLLRHHSVSPAPTPARPPEEQL